MDAAAEGGRNPAIKHQPIRFSPSVVNEQADAGRDGRTCLARQILRHEQGQGNVHFPYLADHKQDLQPYPVDPYYVISYDHTYILYVIVYSTIDFDSPTLEPDSKSNTRIT